MLFSSSHSRPRYTHLYGSSDALALAQYAGHHVPLVVIAASALEAQRLVGARCLLYVHRPKDRHCQSIKPRPFDVSEADVCHAETLDVTVMVLHGWNLEG
jgi:hypothetical protein